MNISIDKDFKALLPVLRDEERDLLRQSIEKEGVEHELVVWKEKGILLDGHHRFAICQELKLKPPIKEISLKDRDAAEVWIYDNQLRRRNLDPNHYSFYRGVRQEVLNRGVGRPIGKQPQNEAINGKTASRLAKEFGVSRATIERDRSFAAGVIELEKAVPGAKSQILNGKATLTKGQIQKLAKMGERIAADPKLKAELADAVNGKKKPEPEGPIDKLHRENAGKPYPWKDVLPIEVIIHSVEKLRPVPISRIKEFLANSPTGRHIKKSGEIAAAAKFLTQLNQEIQ